MLIMQLIFVGMELNGKLSGGMVDMGATPNFVVMLKVKWLTLSLRKVGIRKMISTNATLILEQWRMMLSRLEQL